MKEWCKVTFMKEWLKALDLTVILCYRGLLWLFSFSSNGRLKKKCRYKEISFTKSLLLLKGHFQSGFIFPFQCSITHVYHICRRVQTSLDVLQLVQLVQHNISNRSSLGVERDIAVLQEFLIPGVLWGYFECIHFSEIIMVLLNHLILFTQYYSGVGEKVMRGKANIWKNSIS